MKAGGGVWQRPSETCACVCLIVGGKGEDQSFSGLKECRGGGGGLGGGQSETGGIRQAGRQAGRQAALGLGYEQRIHPTHRLAVVGAPVDRVGWGPLVGCCVGQERNEKGYGHSIDPFIAARTHRRQTNWNNNDDRIGNGRNATNFQNLRSSAQSQRHWAKAAGRQAGGLISSTLCQSQNKTQRRRDHNARATRFRSSGKAPISREPLSQAASTSTNGPPLEL